MVRSRFGLLSVGFALATAALAGPPDALADALAGLDATFVAWNGATGETVRHDPERAAARVSPCSTFKIPNALIALETGVASGPGHVRSFDPERHPRGDDTGDDRFEVLARDHDLAGAIRNSVVWYFQEVAIEIGEDRMAEATARLRTMLAQDHGGGFAVFAKTGAGRTPEGRPLGWWVGWVERPEGPVVFAFRLEADDFASIWRERVPAARRALTAIGAIPEETP